MKMKKCSTYLALLLCALTIFSLIGTPVSAKSTNRAVASGKCVYASPFQTTTTTTSDKQAYFVKWVRYRTTYSTKKVTEWMVVYGENKKGKTIWKYQTKEQPFTKYTRTKCLPSGNTVYVFEGNMVQAFNWDYGKKLWTCKNITSCGYRAVTDSSNLYVTGYDNSLVYKINKKGKISWKKNLKKTGLTKPIKLTYKNSQLTIRYKVSRKDPKGKKKHLAILSTKNGKQIKYY